MNRPRIIHFDWQISLIGLSAVAGLIFAFNWRIAALQFAIVVISIVLYLALASLPDPITVRRRPRSVLSGMMVVLPAAIAVIFLLTNSWSRWIGKLPPLDPILRLLPVWLLGATDPGVNPNVIGSSLAALLPLQVFALRRARRRISVPLIALTLICLLLSQTRGAWLALLLVAGLWMLWRAITRRVKDVGRARRLWLAAAAGCGAAVMALLLSTPLGNQLLDLGGDRRAIWQNSVDLIGDYPITGLGLAGFEMVYATYALLTHVGYTAHAHNLWLNMWLNQGIVGVMALAGMVLNAVWPKPSSVWRVPALLTLGVILLHGLVDDPYYGGAALPVVFVPLGLLIRSDSTASAASTARRLTRQPAFAMWIGAALVFGVGLLTPLGRATVEASLGALAQTQIELSQYRWPDVPIQDALRRAGLVDLGVAEAYYHRALAIDPSNATANRRLGQIELAREQFDAACPHLAAAYQTLPQQRATRQLLGECNAVSGRPEEAAKLWKTVDVGQSQLNIRRWWYDEYLQDQGHAAQFQVAMNVLAGE